MRIISLTFIAYGPFTDTTLDFSDDGPGFHLVYGPNEAGKSTALRGMRHLLFGIPVRTTASFLHPNPNLRISGRLIKSDGTSIEFIRRKGRSKTLRDADDKGLLDDAVLAPFLGGVGKDAFEQMFAIGHEELIQGGEEIISGAGNVGESLFATGAGLVHLQRIREDLDSACQALFKPGGSKPTINQTLSNLKEITRAQKNALLPARKWKEHDQALQKAHDRMQDVRRKLSELKQKSGKLERIVKALPLMARIREIQTDLVPLKGIPQLSADFGKQRRQAVIDLEIARNDLARAEDAIRNLNTRKEAIVVSDDIIAHSGLIETLQHELGSYRKAQKDRPGLEARMKALTRQVSEKLTENALSGFVEEGTPLKLPLSTVGEIQELNTAFERLDTRQASADDRLRKLETRIHSLNEERKKLALPADVASLKTAIQIAQKAGSIESQYSDHLLSITAREDAVASDLKRLSLLIGSAETIDTTRCPSLESVNHFETELTAARRRIEKLQGDDRTTLQEISRVVADLDAIRLSRNVPTERDLELARGVREEGWRLVRSKLEGHIPTDGDIKAFTGKLDGKWVLADAFEKSVEQADEIADRLRREADQVSRKSVLESRKQGLDKIRAALKKDLADARLELAGLKTEWQRRWETAGIDPLSPREMRQWLSDMSSIRERMDAVRADKVKAEAMVAHIESMKARMVAALSGIGKKPDPHTPLSTLIDIGNDYLASQAELASRIEQLGAALATHCREKEEVESELAELKIKRNRWESRWAKNMDAIGVSSDVRPATAIHIIDNIREAKAMVDEADILKKRIDGIDDDADRFRRQVANLVDTLAPDLSGEPPERATVLLNTRLTETREKLSTRKSIESQLTAATEKRQNAEKRVTDIRTLLDSLCRQAGCQRIDELEQVEAHARRLQQLRLEQESVEAQLRELGAGATVEAFIDEAGSIPADRIEPELERIADEINVLDQERSSLDRTIGIEETELKRMDGSAKATEYAEEKQRLLATLESDVEQYARIKTASVILSRTIEQYREKHQGPLVRRASELFSKMTAGSFSGIRAEYDDKDNPILVGIRADQSKIVPIAGMSDGTADQLYLALRLASLEQYLSNHEPLPFIVDDILLRFDDNRATATLQVLADLSKKTQVIFFTHHPHLVHLAKNHVNPETLKQHVLI